MSLTPPSSMDQCIYFSNRSSGESGKIKAWVYRKECPNCGKAKMGKPVEKGKVKVRSTEYVCPTCDYTEPKVEHEESLTLEAQYTCPHCGKDGEGTTPYKRKTYQGVPSYVLICEHCNEKIAITKKMKEPKKKAAKKKA